MARRRLACWSWRNCWHRGKRSQETKHPGSGIHACARDYGAQELQERVDTAAFPTTAGDAGMRVPAPKVRFHTSLGHRPRYRIVSPTSPTTRGMKARSNASGITGAVGHQFRGIRTPRTWSARNGPRKMRRRVFNLGRCPRLVWLRAFGPPECPNAAKRRCAILTRQHHHINTTSFALI